MEFLSTPRVAALGCAFPPAIASRAFAQGEDKRNIIVFGDRITWGWVPKETIVPTTRHAEQDR